MNRILIITALLAVSMSAWGQDARYVFKTDGESAIVWSGPQCSNGTVTSSPLCAGIQGVHADASSIVTDPLTGNVLRQISYQGVTVTTSLMSHRNEYACGYCTTIYRATITLVNNTEYPLKVDGSTFTSTLPYPTEKEFKKGWGKKVNILQFVPPLVVTIQPGQSATLYFFMADHANRDYSGLFFTGSSDHFEAGNRAFDVIPMRYSIRVNGKSFVFPWLAPIWQDFDFVPYMECCAIS
jgi:hypothetical protein